GMYSYTLQGLTQCYIMGLPFLRTNLLGNLLFVPLFTSFALLAWKYYPAFRLSKLLRIKYDSFR
ncbi:unnamed protein product, partial [marine sediment metagenome]